MFQAIEDYPELLSIQSKISKLRNEAALLYSANMFQEMLNDGFEPDRRNKKGVWFYCPLGLEAEDCNDDNIKDSLRNLHLAYESKKAIAEVGNVLGAMLSLLKPSGEIGEHSHDNPYVTAAIPLQSNDNCTLTVGNETRVYTPGEILVFDYTLPHKAVNHGDEDRIVLLLVLPNKAMR